MSGRKLLAKRPRVKSRKAALVSGRQRSRGDALKELAKLCSEALGKVEKAHDLARELGEWNLANDLRRIEEQCSHAKEKLAQIRGTESDDARPTIAATRLAVFDRAAHSNRPTEESTP